MPLSTAKELENKLTSLSMCICMYVLCYMLTQKNISQKQRRGGKVCFGSRFDREA